MEASLARVLDHFSVTHIWPKCVERKRERGRESEPEPVPWRFSFCQRGGKYFFNYAYECGCGGVVWVCVFLQPAPLPIARLAPTLLVVALFVLNAHMPRNEFCRNTTTTTTKKSAT